MCHPVTFSKYISNSSGEVFIGVLLSLVLFREIPGKLFWAALVLMAVGVYLNVKDTEKYAEG